MARITDVLSCKNKAIGLHNKKRQIGLLCDLPFAEI